MDAVAILERIIKEGGNCDWVVHQDSDICSKCPLGRQVREDQVNTTMSCVEALHIEGLTKEHADERYKKAAESKLADLTIEKINKED